MIYRFTGSPNMQIKATGIPRIPCFSERKKKKGTRSTQTHSNKSWISGIVSFEESRDFEQIFDEATSVSHFQLATFSLMTLGTYSHAKHVRYFVTSFPGLSLLPWDLLVLVALFFISHHLKLAKIHGVRKSLSSFCRKR